MTGGMEHRGGWGGRWGQCDRGTSGGAGGPPGGRGHRGAGPPGGRVTGRAGSPGGRAHRLRFGGVEWGPWLGAGGGCGWSGGTAGWRVRRGAGDGWRSRPARRRRRAGALAHAEEAEGAFLLEVQSAAGRGRDPPDPAAQFSDLGPDPGLGQHPKTEGQRGRADVQPPLQVQGQRHRSHILFAELAVTCAACRPTAHRTVRPAARARPRSAAGAASRPGARATARSAARPASRAAARGASRAATSQRGQEAEGLPVAEHPGGRAEPLGGLSDPH